MKTIVPSSNIDSILSAYLYAYLSKDAVVKKYIPSYGEPEIILIRTWMDVEAINAQAERVSTPITIWDGQVSVLDTTHLKAPTKFTKFDTHCMSNQILKMFPDSELITKGLKRLVELIEDYDEHVLQFKETVPLIYYLDSLKGQFPTLDKYYQHLFKKVDTSLASWIKQGKVIHKHMMKYFDVLIEEGVCHYSEDCSIVNGVFANLYLNEDKLLNIAYSVSERSTCTIGYVPTTLTAGDEERLGILFKELGITDGRLQPFCSFTTKWGGTPYAKNEKKVNLDKADLILDDSEYLIQEYVRNHLSQKKANVIDDRGVVFINTQFLSNTLLESYKCNMPWMKTLILWCIRRDGTIRYVERDITETRPLEPSDIQISKGDKFIKRLVQAKKF